LGILIMKWILTAYYSFIFLALALAKKLAFEDN